MTLTRREFIGMLGLTGLVAGFGAAFGTLAKRVCREPKWVGYRRWVDMDELEVHSVPLMNEHLWSQQFIRELEELSRLVAQTNPRAIPDDGKYHVILHPEAAKKYKKHFGELVQ